MCYCRIMKNTSLNFTKEMWKLQKDLKAHKENHLYANNGKAYNLIINYLWVSVLRINLFI